ncbi:unnamed protein product [Brugia timori]|uniref:Uncharacterized protein n=1 Tax=Brugia timori TaxID=42155 RepID=A0A0R3RDH2_9BILA|nr:unnamed protein product [Brugia timori]
MSREPSIINNPSTSEPETVTVFILVFRITKKTGYRRCCFI